MFFVLNKSVLTEDIQESLDAIRQTVIHNILIDIWAH